MNLKTKTLAKLMTLKGGKYSTYKESDSFQDLHYYCVNAKKVKIP